MVAMMGRMIRTMVRTMILLTGFIGLGLICHSTADASKKSSGANQGSDKTIVGSGNVISEEATDISNFDKIAITGEWELHITQGDQEALKVEAEDNIIPVLDATVSGGTLNLGLKPASIEITKPVKFFVTVKNLQGIQSEGKNIISNDGTLKADHLNLDIRGLGQTNLSDLDVKTLTVRMMGNTSATLSGKAVNQNIDITGIMGTSFDGKNLQGQQAQVHLMGLGSVIVNVSDKLDIDLNGSGKVTYYGKPQITQSSSGNGQIIQGD